MRGPVDLRIYRDLLDKREKDQPKPEDEVYHFCSPDHEPKKKEDEE